MPPSRPSPRRRAACAAALRSELFYLWPFPLGLRTNNIGFSPVEPEVAADRRHRAAPEGLQLYREAGALLADLPRAGPGPDILEIGCGRGGGLAALADLHGPRFLGIDRSRVAVLTARLAGRPVRHASATALPFAEGRFAGVLAVEMLFRSAESARFLAEVARVLAPGGRLAVADFLQAPFATFRAVAAEAGAAAGLRLVTAADRTEAARRAVIDGEPRRRRFAQTLPAPARRHFAASLNLAGTPPHAEWVRGGFSYLLATFVRD